MAIGSNSKYKKIYKPQLVECTFCGQRSVTKTAAPLKRDRNFHGISERDDYRSVGPEAWKEPEPQFSACTTCYSTHRRTLRLNLSSSVSVLSSMKKQRNNRILAEICSSAVCSLHEVNRHPMLLQVGVEGRLCVYILKGF